MTIKQIGDDKAIPFLLVNELGFCDVEQANGHSNGATSFFMTTFNGLNALSGAGILSIMFIIAAATYYTGLLIKRCMDVDPGIKRYPDIGWKAFGTKGSRLSCI